MCEDGGSLQGSCKILQMRNGVPVWDQLPDEGRTIPISNIWPNSCRAIHRHSGAKRRACANTGGPVVSIW